MHQNDAEYKLGFRPEFLQTPIIYGKKFFISLANGEKHSAQFALVDLPNILASHNERTFGPTAGYPTIDGHNINDRNYHQDTYAQGQVISYAENLDPNRLVTNSKTDSGTPIITIDGIVVSGNNRTMSLKRAAEDFPELYQQYMDEILNDLAAFGIDEGVGHAAIAVGRVHVPGNAQGTMRFTKPAIVRIDYDFAAYTTTELSKFNKDRKKSERPVDKAIKLGKILNESSRCKEVITNIVGEYETFTEFYSNYNDQKKLRQVLLECNIINENELAAYFDERGFTEGGKDLIENMLAGLVLDNTALLAGNLPGVRNIRNTIITSLPVLVKNGGLPTGDPSGDIPRVSLLPDINAAFLLQSAMAASGLDFEYYIGQGNMFDEKPAYRTLVINRLLNSGRNKFKGAIEAYNEAVINNHHASLFDDKITVDQIFDRIIVKRLSVDDRLAIDRIANPVNIEALDAGLQSIADAVYEKVLSNRAHFYNTLENNLTQPQPVLLPMVKNAFQDVFTADIDTLAPAVAHLEKTVGYDKFYQDIIDRLYDFHINQDIKKSQPTEPETEQEPLMSVPTAEEIATVQEPAAEPDPTGYPWDLKATKYIEPFAWDLPQDEYVKQFKEPREGKQLKLEQRRHKIHHKKAVQSHIEGKNYLADITRGKKTPEYVKQIIESAGLPVPAYVTDKLTTETTMSQYHDLIIAATGCQPSDAEEIEGYMRHVIFHSTLDWQSKAKLEDAARTAWADIQFTRTQEGKNQMEEITTEKTGEALVNKKAYFITTNTTPQLYITKLHPGAGYSTIENKELRYEYDNEVTANEVAKFLNGKYETKSFYVDSTNAPVGIDVKKQTTATSPAKDKFYPHPLLPEIEKAYYAEPNPLKRDMVLNRFVLNLAGPKNKILRQQFMSALKGKKVPVSQCGVHALELEIIGWLIQNNPAAEEKIIRRNADNSASEIVIPAQKPATWVTIKSPKEINDTRVVDEIAELIEAGIKTNEILLHMEFITDEPQKLTDKFQVLKNKVAFNLKIQGTNTVATAIAGLKTLMEISDAKEKKSIKAAIEGLKLLVTDEFTPSKKKYIKQHNLKTPAELENYKAQLKYGKQLDDKTEIITDVSATASEKKFTAIVPKSLQTNKYTTYPVQIEKKGDKAIVHYRGDTVELDIKKVKDAVRQGRRNLKKLHEGLPYKIPVDHPDWATKEMASHLNMKATVIYNLYPEEIYKKLTYRW